MPFKIKELNELVDGVVDNFDAQLEDSDAGEPGSNLNVIASIFAGQLYQYASLYQTHQFAQIFPDTCEREYLDRWGRTMGTLRKEASRATGKVTISGTDSIFIAGGTVLVRANGVQYQVIDSVSISAGSARADVRALSTGSAGNMDQGQLLRYQTAISGVAADIVVDYMIGGSNQETDADYRPRVLDKFNRTSRGGSTADFVAWAKEVEGVTAAWAAQEMGVGTVTVRFLMRDVRATDYGVPTVDDIAKVEAHIDTKRPVTSHLFVESPSIRPVNITIANLQPNTAEVKQSICKELTDLFERSAEPGVVIHVSTIWEAVSAASGEKSHTIVQPAENTTLGTNEIARLGLVKYG